MIEVKVSADGMMAEVSVNPEEDGEELTEELIRDNLRLEGVQAGIDNEAVSQIVSRKMYNVFVPVARGKSPVNGENARYEFFFPVGEQAQMPRIREDGSVDYSKVVANVNEGDLLARYYPETGGTFGFNIFAKALSPVRGKPKRQLGCKNVSFKDNRYYAEQTGHATLKSNTISVQNVLEISEDANFNTGNLQFRGDIHVHGNIEEGITVRAEGSVIVDGIIGDAKVYAGHDVIIGRGIHGQGASGDEMPLREDATMVEAGGSLKAKFIDHAFVKTGEDVVVDYAVASVIDAQGKVTAQGSRGAIVGGRTTAVVGIEAQKFGNQAELLTEIQVGECSALMEELTAVRQQLKALEEGGGDFQDAGNRQSPDAVRKRMLELEVEIRKRQQAPIILHQTIYPNVRLFFGELRAPDMGGRQDVEFRKINGRILSQKIGSYKEEEFSSLTFEQNAQLEAVEKIKVLVVDDDFRFLRTVNQILEETYQVAVAKSGRVARKFLEKNSVDLILLDYMMPEENGVEVLKSLRAWDKTKDIPVVFLTGLSDKKKILECLSLHPAGYILKPVQRQELLTKVRAVVGEQ